MAKSCRFGVALPRQLVGVCIVAGFFALHAGFAQAALERIETHISPDQDDAPGEANIVIHFDERILYERHAPLSEGKILRIRVRLLDSGSHGVGFFEETLYGQKIDRAPFVTVTFSGADNELSVVFSKVTRYAVRPGSDGRSLVITTPLSPSTQPPKPVKAAPPIQEPVVKGVPALPPPAAPPPPVAAPPASKEAPIQPLAKPPVPPAEAPIVAAAPVPATPVQAAAPADVEALANQFMAEARRAMEAKDYATVVNRCYRILGLQMNGQTEPAQAWIGEVREANGEIAKARAEYELYLKLYPKGPNAARVREKLAALPKQTAATVARKRELPKEAGPAEWLYFGSVGTTYYSGKSQTDTSTLPSGVSTASQSSLSLVDQKSLISTINLNARRRDAFSDTRIVFRDTDNRNYLNSSRSYNRVYSFYVDHNDKKIGYYVRAGRQNPSGLGVLERFDGLQGGYNLGDKWRLNGVYGEAVEFDSPFKKTFYGASLDLLPDAERPGVSVYAIEQKLDGFANRRALGAEARYFDSHITGYGLLDYDVLYKDINIALLQGNYLTDGGTNYFVIIDRRQAPSFGLTSALLTAPGLTLQQMITAQGLDSVRNQAKAVTAISSMLNAGFTHPLTERWQVGADYRVTEISATQPVTVTVPLSTIGTCVGTVDVLNNTCTFDTASQAASGKTHAVTLQATGSNLFVTNAVGLGSASFIKAVNYDGTSLSLTYLLPIGEHWHLDTSWRYYTQKDNLGAKQDRNSGSMKFSYQWNNALFWEGEYGQEVSNSSSSTQTDRTKRDYFYTGVRWDFR